MKNRSPFPRETAQIITDPKLMKDPLPEGVTWEITGPNGNITVQHAAKEEERPVMATKTLPAEPTQALNLKSHEESRVRVESIVGENHLMSRSPVSQYYVLFDDEDEGYGGVFYAGLEGKKSPIIDSMTIYNLEELLDRDKKHQFEIVWSKDGQKVALLINNHFHAVFDFEALKGYCRTGEAHVGNYGFKTNHKWSNAAINLFLDPQDALAVPPEGPSAKDKQTAFIRDYLKPMLKKCGFQTSGQKWWKDCGDFFIAIHLVNSSYNTREEVGFHFSIGPALKSQLCDPAKKKVVWQDMRFSEFDETAHLADKHRNPYRRNDHNLIILKDDSDDDDFLREMRFEWEEEVLPSLDKLQTLNDWVKFYEASLWLSAPRAAEYIKKEINS